MNRIGTRGILLDRNFNATTLLEDSYEEIISNHLRFIYNESKEENESWCIQDYISREIHRALTHDAINKFSIKRINIIVRYARYAIATGWIVPSDLKGDFKNLVIPQGN
jgi:hypothetical protein